MQGIGFRGVEGVGVGGLVLMGVLDAWLWD